MKKSKFVFSGILLAALCVPQTVFSMPAGISDAAKSGISNATKPERKKPVRPPAGRAVSLRALQGRVRQCMAERDCPDEMLRLYGLKKIIGYVVDGRSRDILLVGKTEGAAEALYLEDFVVALRNSHLIYAKRRGNAYYYSSPACSIDPEPGVLKELEKISGEIRSALDREAVEKGVDKWEGACRRPQRVRVVGVPHDTHFSEVMLEADYYLKRLVDGSVRLDGIESLTDMALDALKNREEGEVDVPFLSMNRFWFYPGKSVLMEYRGLVFIREFKIGLLTEEEFRKGPGGPNDPARRFASNFSKRFDEIAKVKPVFAELEGLYRFVVLAKLLRLRDAPLESGVSLDYFLKLYPVKTTRVSRTVPGISGVKELKLKTEEGYAYLWLPSCGGVSMDIKVKEADIKKDESGELAKFKARVLSSRPSRSAVYWDYYGEIPFLSAAYE